MLSWEFMKQVPNWIVALVAVASIGLSSFSLIRTYDNDRIARQRDFLTDNRICLREMVYSIEKISLEYSPKVGSSKKELTDLEAIKTDQYVLILNSYRDCLPDEELENINKLHHKIDKSRAVVLRYINSIDKERRQKAVNKFHASNREFVHSMETIPKLSLRNVSSRLKTISR